MELIDQILSQARNSLFCPICQSHYEVDRLKFRGFIDNTYIFQGFCANSHEPMVVTYLASLHRLEKPIGTYFHTLSGNKITQEVADQASKEIKEFSGTFSEIWKD
jgi:hypothetical protein